MNTGFESILLKKLIYSAPFYGKVMPILRKKYFTDIGNQELFGLIVDYYGEYHDIISSTTIIPKA